MGGWVAVGQGQWTLRRSVALPHWGLGSSCWVWGGRWGLEGPRDAVPWQAKDAMARCGEACGMGRAWP